MLENQFEISNEKYLITLFIKTVNDFDSIYLETLLHKLMNISNRRLFDPPISNKTNI